MAAAASAGASFVSRLRQGCVPDAELDAVLASLDYLGVCDLVRQLAGVLSAPGRKREAPCPPEDKREVLPSREGKLARGASSSDVSDAVLPPSATTAMTTTATPSPTTAATLTAAQTAAAATATTTTANSRQQRRRKKAATPLNWADVPTRHVAFHIAYMGESLHGFASVDATEETVEGHLFPALMRTKLIQDRASCGYTRCGRTDKGVSALGQVISMHVRSKQPGDDADELPYVSMLNSSLPPCIRVLGWHPVPHGFSARFSCLHRTYRYFFLRGSLDIDRMQQAATRLIGDHDFRNMCKIDAVNVDNFRRVVLSASIERVAGAAPGPAQRDQVYCFQVCGYAFLWHQVRCMVEILFMIGRGLEQPDVIDRLLDVDAMPGKPMYRMAPDGPLLLYQAGFEEIVCWRRDASSHRRLVQHLEAAVTEAMMQTCVRQAMLTAMRQALVIPDPVHGRTPQPWERIEHLYHRAGKHIPLLQRNRDTTVAEKVASLTGKKKQLHAEKVAARQQS